MKLRQVPRDPIIGTNHFCHKSNLRDLYPFNEPNILLFGYARIALLDGMIKLGLKEGDEILVPSYICNGVLAPMHYLKLRIRFYDVDHGLRPDWDSVKKNLSAKSTTVLVVNYFGFPTDGEEARKICDRYHLRLIEDNAHGFLSRSGSQHLGTYGDISVFSFRKTVCVPNGAAVVFNEIGILSEGYAGACYRLGNSRSSLRFFARSGITTLQCLLGLKRYTAPSLKDLCDDPYQDQNEEYEVANYLYPMSPVSRHLMERIDFDRHASERQQMYQQWVEFFNNRNHYSGEKVRILWPNLPSGVVPYVFPLLVKNRADLIRDYWRQGIQCFPWPFLPRDSRENYFTKRLVCLPVSSYFRISDFLGK